jgi:hypothetical protein
MAYKMFNNKIQTVLFNQQWLNIYPNGTCTIALDSKSYAWAWGPNTSGQLGNGTGSGNFNSPTSVVGGKQWLSLITTPISNLTNFSHTLGLDSLSYAWAWGTGTTGQLGNNLAVAQSSPVSVVGDKQWLSLSTHRISVLALDNLSYAWAWGDNTNGQLGTNTVVLSSSPVSVVGGKQWTNIITYGYTISSTWTIALDNLSYAWAWGSGGIGNLGNNAIVNQSSPVSVVGGKQWLKLVTGFGGASNPVIVGIDNLSYAWAWGAGSGGVLGTNDIANASSPVSVVGGKQWINIAFYGPAVLALDNLSYAWAWGLNSSGQLGNNTVASASSPISVVGGKQWTDIKSTSQGFIAIDSSSYIWGWGGNTTGILGNNAVASTSSPVSVVGDKQFKSVQPTNANGVNFVLALDPLSYAYAWGIGTSGQLGQGVANISRSSPVSVYINAYTIGLANPFGI